MSRFNRLDVIARKGVRDSVAGDLYGALRIQTFAGLTPAQGKQLKARAHQLLFYGGPYKTETAKKRAMRRLLRLVREWHPEGLAKSLAAAQAYYKRTTAERHAAALKWVNDTEHEIIDLSVR